MWKILIADDHGHKTVINLVRDEYSLGRAPVRHLIQLTERNISRDHAIIHRTPTGFRIEDTSSYNGLYVNGVRVVGRQDLAHGDLVQLGDYRIQVVDEAIDTQEQGYRLIAGESAVPGPGRLPHRLVELIGPTQGAEYPLEGERFLIGRGPECEFPIDHGSVSRIHAEVRSIGDDRFEVIDKGSANGLRVNGQPRDRALLDGRDVIELGDVVLKYIPEGQVFHASASEGARIAALAGASLPPTPTRPARNGIVPNLLAASVGAVAVCAVGFAVISGNNQRSELAEENPTIPQELAAVSKLLAEGDLLKVGEEFDRLGEAERALASFRTLETTWAEQALRSTPSRDGDEKYRKLLDQVARRESLAPALREQASKKLSALSEGAIDLGALELASPGTASGKR